MIYDICDILLSQVLLYDIYDILLSQVLLAFRALDKDGSGTVETAEFKHLMTHVGESSQ